MECTRIDVFVCSPYNLSRHLSGKESIEAALDALAENPRPRGSIRMKGYDDLYRVRVGDWRIVYAIEDDQLIVMVIEVGPRGDVYRRLA